eukprot:gnl/TRDRNA2_/TRDRNA2_143728_c2_seq1.p1 gnl/TRDRNA2_/TRDRNA2_143728_c2~~gnl/TRDRNA2_/TRDRNA2_143728_c2_seq1.p1  ORF type:complete len:657 (-),score=155.25 gnl/TRDRNA2_/TRDRNA2_143728_c2_seq1:168-1976(-)
MIDDESFQKQAKRVAEQMEAMMAEPNLHAQVKGLFASQMKAMQNGTALQQQVKLVAVLEEAMKDRPNLQAQAKIIAEQLEAMMADENLVKQASSIHSQIRAMMADPQLAAEANLAADQMKALIVDLASSEHMKLIAKQMERVMTDPHLQKQAKSMWEMWAAPKPPEDASLTSDQMKLPTQARVRGARSQDRRENLVGRALNTSPLNRASLDKTTLGKSASLASPAGNSKALQAPDELAGNEMEYEHDLRHPYDLEAGERKSQLTLLEKIREQYEKIPRVVRIEDLPTNSLKKQFATAPEVGVGVKVMSISHINMAEGTFDACFNINVAWKGSTDDKPELVFYNAHKGFEIEKDMIVKGKGWWDWVYRLRIQGTFRQEYDLQWFPFDHQELKIVVQFKSKCKLVNLPWGHDGETCSCDPRCFMDEYIITDFTVQHTYMPLYKFGELASFDPEASLVFTVGRKSVYWVFNYGIISSIITSIMACTYAIPVADISGRLGAATTLVLTMLATKFLMMDKLPAIPYFTTLDYHMLVCMLFLAMMTVELGFTKKIGVDAMIQFEEWFLPATGILWVSYHVMIILAILKWTRFFKYSRMNLKGQSREVD